MFGLVDTVWALLIPYCINYTFMRCQKGMLVSSYLVHSRYFKMHQQEILSIGRNVLEYFWVLLYTDYLSYLHKKFHVASIYDYTTHADYQILSFCRDLSLSYADNRHTDQVLKMWFSELENINACKSIKISISKILLKNYPFSTIYG